MQATKNDYVAPRCREILFQGPETMFVTLSYAAAMDVAGLGFGETDIIDMGEAF